VYDFAVRTQYNSWNNAAAPPSASTRHSRPQPEGRINRYGSSFMGNVTAVEGPEAFLGWPVFRQLAGADRLGRGEAARSRGTRSHVARTETADRVVQSVCPYCAVGCGQRVYVKDERVVQIEGDIDSPVSRGRLCPKGAASEQLVNSPGRQTKVLYRRPYGTEWEPLDLETATNMIADRVIDTRSRTWEEREDDGALLNRTLGIAGLGGATLDNEENYLIKKLFTAMGAIQIENQARI
jgi:formate dehydrogenase major subunit